MTNTLRFFLVLLLVSSSIFAGTTGKIVGRITDASTGEALPFVNVIIMGTNSGAATDIDGYFAILNVPPGTYEVKASAIGYNSVTMQNVKVSIDLTTDINFELSSTSIELSEEVVVVATKPLIQKDLTSSTAIVGDELISELPVTDISDVLSLQSGIVISGDGGLHLRGGRAGQVTYQIDGVPVTDSYDGSTIVDVNSSAVQELQVISGAFNAEYGQALSGVINLVTKDGGNDRFVAHQVGEQPAGGGAGVRPPLVVDHKFAAGHIGFLNLRGSRSDALRWNANGRAHAEHGRGAPNFGEGSRWHPIRFTGFSRPAGWLPPSAHNGDHLV